MSDFLKIKTVYGEKTININHIAVIEHTVSGNGANIIMAVKDKDGKQISYITTDYSKSELDSVLLK